MKLPRDLSGADLAKALSKVGYSITRQTGSHIRLSTDSAGRHHVTIPAHDTLRVGTLSKVIGEVAAHMEIDRDDLLRQLFDWIRDDAEMWIVIRDEQSGCFGQHDIYISATHNAGPLRAP